MRSMPVAVLAVVALFGAGEAGAQTPCPSGAEPVGHPGFSIACDCTVSIDRWPERPWRFRSPIEIRSVEAGGPADGRLNPGDLLLAVDGAAVTEREGARRLAEMQPGETVRLTVRREGRERTVELRAGAICPTDRRALGAYAPSPLTGRGDSAPAGAGAAAPVPTTPDLLPPGRLGLALACRRCGWERNAGDPFPRWHSVSPPIIYSVAPEGPAARAGIRAGDTLVEVDGRAITSRLGGERLGAASPGDRLSLVLERDGRRYQAILLVGEPAPDQGIATRFTGTVGGVAVEVRSAAPASVTTSADGQVMVIRVGETEVRLRAPGGSGTP